MLEKTGDLREAVAKFMDGVVGMKDDDHDQRSGGGNNGGGGNRGGGSSDVGDDKDGGGGVSVTTTECIPDPSSKQRVVPRIDCAHGFVRWWWLKGCTYTWCVHLVSVWVRRLIAIVYGSLDKHRRSRHRRSCRRCCCCWYLDRRSFGAPALIMMNTR